MQTTTKPEHKTALKELPFSPPPVRPKADWGQEETNKERR